MVSGEKRNCDEENVLEKITAILLDIEGTTTSISFVKETLFPYVRENLKSYVESHWDDEEFKADLKALKSQAKKDEEDKVENFSPIEEGEKEKETLIKNVLWQMDLDRKTTALKQLQGHIWKEGYENGKLKGHIYGDVPQMLKKWCEDGRKLYIYSSGSVEAQKLLFKNTESGDLSEFLSGYFDTETGPKTEATSYASIAKSIGSEASQILFLTDVVKEAVAADKAGFQVMIVIREGNAPIADDEKKAFTTITSFKDIVFETSSKKKKICEDETVREEGEETQQVEAAEEATEKKNGEAEQMEVETAETKVEESKTEAEEKPEPEATETPETENINVDVEESAAAPAQEKTVSSNQEEEEGKNGSTEDEKVEVEKVEEPKEAEVTNGNEKAEGEKKENGEVSVNGHETVENGENKENKEENSKEKVEENKKEENGKIEEVEAVSVKKVTGEEQADSAVEVVA